MGFTKLNLVLSYLITILKKLSQMKMHSQFDILLMLIEEKISADFITEKDAVLTYGSLLKMMKEADDLYNIEMEEMKEQVRKAAAGEKLRKTFFRSVREIIDFKKQNGL